MSFEVLILVVAIIILAVLLFGAAKMQYAAEQKGYGPEYHIMGICFWLGLFGYLYVIALPDRKSRAAIEELSKIDDQLRINMDTIIEKMNQTDNAAFPDELPDL